MAELKVAVPNILEAASMASGIEVKTLFENIDFLITDQTVHNLGIEGMVADRRKSKYNPDHLFCNVHPSLMFNRVITEKLGELNSIGPDKIYSRYIQYLNKHNKDFSEVKFSCSKGARDNCMVNQ